MSFASGRRGSVSGQSGGDTKLRSLPGLEDMFNEFCSTKTKPELNGIAEMDGPTFAKLCRDSGLQAKGKLSSTSVDIIFSSAKVKGERKLTYTSFLEALNAAAKELGVPYESLAREVAHCSGPVFSGTAGTGFTASTIGRRASMSVEEIELPPPPDVKGLEDVFQAYNIFGGGDLKAMPNDKYIKLCKECGIIDSNYDTTSADLVFSKVKPRGERKIDYKMFMDVLNMIAYQKGASYESVAKTVISFGGPVNKGTKADAVKFHDDKNLWTGAYGAVIGRRASVKEQGIPWREAVKLPADTKGLKDVFTAFCSFGGNDPTSMDSQVYSKFCVDTKLYTYSNVKDADLVFFKAKKRGERRLTYDDFRLCLYGIAEDKGITYNELVSQVLKADGPNLRATKADAVRFHDDKSLYTGAQGAIHGRRASIRDNRPWREGRTATKVAGMEKVFNAFNVFGGGNPDQMSGDKFVKALKDSGLLGSKFTSQDADIVFSKAKKAPGVRTLEYEDFLLALECISEETGVAYMEICNALLRGGGPQNSGTEAEAVRFHDDKSLYTGAYGANIGRSATIKEVKNWKDGRIPKPVPGLEAVFKSFNSFAGGNAAAMTGEKWVKILRDSGIFDKYSKGPTEADIVFSKVKMPNARVLNFDDFLLAVECLAETVIGAPYYDVAEMLLHCEGPKASGTRAEACRFYDEKDISVRDRRHA